MLAGPLSFWNSWKEEKRAKARSDKIDLNILQESKSLKQQYNVLLISIPESEMAASTFVKRMKTMHDGHYHDEPARFNYEKLVDFRPVIWRILLQNSQSVVRGIRSRNIVPACRSNKANCEYIMNYPIDTESPQFFFLPKFSRAIQDLWAEEIIPVLLEDPPCLSVDDSTAYFFAEAQRIVAEEYVPSIEDIRHVSEKKIMETSFKMGQPSIRVLQVSGQVSARRKWIHQFESIPSILFYAPLSDYDRPVAGWSEQTRLAESLTLFDAVVNSRWFLRTSIILLLTDIAEFKTKIHEVPLAQFCPEYTGGADVNKGAKFILWRFMQSNRSRLDVYPHIAEASDTSSLRLIFVTVKKTILQNALKDSGII